ncbi:MAG TPA: AAA family ATPase [Candidatus Ozemobacteraceae bacterium]|nr:AAA family ATPase [Candidatus Ozemobacteraceae bacterium]HQG28684.1 AAA family ATPase [Candidatus Ozemobacteraceae bacterium]
MTDARLVPFTNVLTASLPRWFQSALDTAASECKRRGHTCLDLPHLLLGILRDCPQLIQAKISADQRGKLEDSLLKGLEKESAKFSPDVSGVSLPEPLAAAIRAYDVGGMGNAGGDFLTVLEAHLPGQLDFWLAREPGSTAVPPTARVEGKLPQEDTHTPAKPAPEQPATEKASEKPEAEPPAAGPAIIRPPYTVIWDDAFLNDAPEELPGRELEVQSLAIELSRRTPSGIIILGPPKSGKTTLVRSFARMVRKGCWKPLEGFTFYGLDMPTLVSGIPAGTISHADFIETITKVAQNPRAILVVDPAHILFGLGGPGGFHDLLSDFRGVLLHRTLRVLFVMAPKFQKEIIEDNLVLTPLHRISLGFLSGQALSRTVEIGLQNIGRTYRKTVPAALGGKALELHGDMGRAQVCVGDVLKTVETSCILAEFAGRPDVSPDDLILAYQREQKAPDVSAQERLANLEEELARRVKGQSEAIRAVAPRIRMTRLQLDRNPNRPDGVFLFLGPSGVGKTELAKAITLSLYNDLTRLIRLDMSEFMSEHEYSKLIGAPPGYVGHGEDGHLTGPVARLGHGVILLDEIEKAHPAILKMFLQVFDEGFLTDGRGRRVDFSRCVMIMTSNLGRELYAEGKPKLGFLKPSDGEGAPASIETLNYLLKILPSEFINRIDKIVPFQPLSKEHLAEIARKMLDEETERWLKRGYTLTFGDEIIPLLIDSGYDPRLGARHLTRNFEGMITQLLSEAACREDWVKFHSLRIAAEKGTVQLFKG